MASLLSVSGVICGEGQEGGCVCMRVHWMGFSGRYAFQEMVGKNTVEQFGITASLTFFCLLLMKKNPVVHVVIVGCT